MVEQHDRIDFRDAHTMALATSVPLPCRGVNHAGFSPNGRYFIASCEFSGQLVKIDVVQRRLLAACGCPNTMRCRKMCASLPMAASTSWPT